MPLLGYNVIEELVSQDQNSTGYLKFDLNMHRGALTRTGLAFKWGGDRGREPVSIGGGRGMGDGRGVREAGEERAGNGRGMQNADYFNSLIR